MSIDFPQIPLYDVLCNAASRGHVNIGKLLLDRGAALENPDNITISAMYLAVLNGQTEFVRLLLQYGFCVDSRHCDGCTPLMVVAERSHLDIAQLLLQAGKTITSMNAFYSFAMPY